MRLIRSRCDIIRAGCDCDPEQITERWHILSGCKPRWFGESCTQHRWLCRLQALHFPKTQCHVAVRWWLLLFIVNRESEPRQTAICNNKPRNQANHWTNYLPHRALILCKTNICLVACGLKIERVFKLHGARLPSWLERGRLITNISAACPVMGFKL